MNAVRQLTSLTVEEKDFLNTLLYFDIFNYPLTAEEIIQYSQTRFGFSPGRTLALLVSKKKVFQFQGFYLLRKDYALVQRRLKGNALAKKKMQTARIFSRLVYFIPFVRAVMLSGSISKGYMEEKSDIDYFIVTEKNRLWLVRSALAIFRRLFLFNSGKNLCTNYFVDTQNLEIQEKNIFTAIELVSLRPVCGATAILNFRSANTWVYSFLPNAEAEQNITFDKPCSLKTVLEKLLSAKAIDRFNERLMEKTYLHWQRRYGDELDASDFKIAFRSAPGISKSHPRFFQKKILTRYAEKIRAFEIQHQTDLSL